MIMEFVGTIVQYERGPIEIANIMPSGGSLTLGDVAAHTAVLAVACSRCDRAAQYGCAARFLIVNVVTIRKKECQCCVTPYSCCPCCFAQERPWPNRHRTLPI